MATVPSRTVFWTYPRYKKLKQAYTKAVQQGDDSFILKDLDEKGDVELITAYAKYVIEQIELSLREQLP